MPFCRTRLSAKRFIAGVGGNVLLLADNHIVEQAFKLRRHPRINQGRVGLFENTEQRQAGLGRRDVLSLGNQETLFLQPADDLRSGRRRANALGLLQTLPQNLIVNKAPGARSSSTERPS
jgi:hypothetical protein